MALIGLGYALFVTDVQLLPLSSGNRLRILNFLYALKELGWKVALVAPPDVAPSELIKQLVDDFLPVRAPRFSGGHLWGFDANPFRRAVNIVAARVHPLVAIAQYAWLGPALSDLPPDVQRWIDCHDVLHERTKRFGTAGLHPWAICTWEEERRCLQWADVIITTQEREAALLQGLMPDKQVRCVLTPVDPPRGFLRAPGSGTMVLTVGARHPGNLAVADFVRDAWPRVLKRIPDAKLHVVGSIGQAVSPTAGVEIFGWVPDLESHYASAAVVVCPVTTGTGVKTKLLEALRYGKAAVATPEAVEGLPVPKGRAWIVAESVSACADAVIEVLTNVSVRHELETNAFAFGLEYVATAAFRARLRCLLATERFPVTSASQSRDQDRTVSVVVPHEGGFQQLRSCLKSLAEQAYPLRLCQIIVVTQTISPVMYAAISDEFPGTVVIRESRAGPSAARNRGAAYSRNHYIAFLDSDCRVHSDWLSNMVRAAEEQLGDCVVAGSVRPLISRLFATGAAWYDALVLHKRRHGAQGQGGGVSSILMKRDVWERVGPFDEEYTEPSWEGYDWLKGAEARGVRIVSAPGAAVAQLVERTWSGLRSISRRLARGERLQALKRGAGVDVERKLQISRRERLVCELRLALRGCHAPWIERLGVAFAAILVWRWSGAETSIPQSASHGSTPGLSRVFADPRETRNLPLRSVSVIIPCRGWPTTLLTCLNALRNQNINLPMEIIVVIDGWDAADPCPPGVQVIMEPRRGPAAARNAGVRASSGDVLAFIDADCVASPRWLAAGLRVLRSDADTIVAGAITRSGAARSWAALYDSVTYLQQEAYVHGSIGFVTANLLIHRAVFDRIGPFDVAFNEAAFEDQEWAVRAQGLGVPVSYASHAVVDHPCMVRVAEVQRKAERLARGALLMQRKLGQPLVVPNLFATLCGEVRKAFREPKLGLGNQLRLICVGAIAGISGWRAGRRYLEIAGSR